MIIVALAAFGGGILAALLGWADSHEPFDGKKFIKSLLMALLAGIGFAVAYSFQDGVTTKDVFLAILGGAGWDSISNRALGALKP